MGKLIRATGPVLRQDYFGEVRVDLPSGKVTPLPTRHHVLCGTCVGEYERHCGYFESQRRRESVGDVTVLTAKQSLGSRKEFCCNCGQLSYVEAVYEQEPGSVAGGCDGLHETPSEEDLEE